jgi:4-amino-4-deoxy-L-arabinose transferase and related glycosyltransferases of PMT family
MISREETMTIDARKLLTPAVILGAATLLIHLLANAGYGIFRDELYFIVCGRRLAWGYVDQPPLVPMLAAWSWALSDGWLTGFRLIPALMMALTVAATAEFARQLGGGRFAQGLAGLCALMAPQFLALGLIFTTDTFQAISWLACAMILVRIEQTKDQRWWLAFGAVVGISLLSKYMIAFYIGALAIGLLATPMRRALLRPWVYGGAVVAIVLVLPNVWWQQAHGWPFLELGKAAMNGKNIALSPGAYFAQQLLLIGPLAAPVWIAGLWGCLYRPRAAVLRAFPIAYVLLLAFFVATHGKAYFLTSIYPILLAVGAARIEQWVASTTAKAAMLALVGLSGAVLAPFAIPLMSEESYIRYAAALGMGPSTAAAEHLKQGRLPQVYADMHGWKAMAEKVAAAYHALPPQDRAKAVFFGSNYGESGAIDVYGEKLGLPPAIGGHNNYWLWGPRGADGSVVIEFGGTREDHLKDFRSVELVGMLDDPYAMPYETNKPIWVERGLKKPLSEVWPKVKHYE